MCARILVLAFAFLASCTALPSRVADPEQELAIGTAREIHDTDPLTGYESLRMTWTPAVEGFTCTLSNDSGTWTVRTPGTVRVRRSLAPLNIECIRAGYEPVQLYIPCVDERQAAQALDRQATLKALTYGPLAILAAPVAPSLAGQALTEMSVMGTASLANHLTGKNSNLCTYAEVRIPPPIAGPTVR